MLLVVPGLLDAGRVQVARRNWAMLRPRACIVPTWQRCGDDPDLDEAIDGPIDGEEDGPRLPDPARKNKFRGAFLTSPCRRTSSGFWR